MISYDPCEPAPILLWDTEWCEDIGDWVMDDTSLKDDNVLLTAVVLQLFTDKRAPDDVDLPGFNDDDRRGWFGDYVDVRAGDGETEMGSLIWIYERDALTDATITGVSDTVEDAMQVLVNQGLIASFEVEVTADKILGHLSVVLSILSQDGSRRFDQKFTRIWEQLS